jgi:hypothetical protein
VLLAIYTPSLEINVSQVSVLDAIVAPTGKPPGCKDGFNPEFRHGNEYGHQQRGYRYSNLRPYTTGMFWKSLQG